MSDIAKTITNQRLGQNPKMLVFPTIKDKVLIYVVPGLHVLLVLNVIKQLCCYKSNRSALNMTDCISGGWIVS